MPDLKEEEGWKNWSRRASMVQRLPFRKDSKIESEVQVEIESEVEVELEFEVEVEVEV
jgi:hypothetical protein